jgi:hypothetical protein
VIPLLYIVDVRKEAVVQSRSEIQRSMIPNTPMFQALVTMSGIRDHAELIRARFDHGPDRLDVQGNTTPGCNPLQGTLD